MSKWREVKLKSVAKVISGFAFKSGDFRKDSGIPAIKIKNIKNGDVDLAECDYVDNKFLSLNEKYHVNQNDILVSLTGSHLTQPNSVVGRIALYRHKHTSLLNQRAGKILPDLNLVNPFYLYSYLSQDSVKESIALKARGAANQANISPGDVEDTDLTLPPIQIQNKIASILSAYDDLIENNLKRIKLLEELALRTYEEWFVNRVINGAIVNDSKFEICPLYDLIETYMNGGWGKEIEDGTYSAEAYVIRGTDMPDLLNGVFSSLPLRFHSEKNLKPRKLKRGDIIIEMSNGNMNSVGRSFFFDGTFEARFNKPFMCASFCKMMRPKNLDLAYLIDLHLKYIHSTNNMLIYKAQGANGINNFRFEDMINEEELFIPKDGVFNDLISAIKSIYELAANLRIQVSLLKGACDILLPRLIGGEINLKAKEETLAIAAEPFEVYKSKSSTR